MDDKGFGKFRQEVLGLLKPDRSQANTKKLLNMTRTLIDTNPKGSRRLLNDIQHRAPDVFSRAHLQPPPNSSTEQPPVPVENTHISPATNSESNTEYGDITPPILYPDDTSPCQILYDPCTGKPLETNTIQALEQRVRSIRSTTVDNPETEKFPSHIKTRLDLLLDLLNKSEPPSNRLFKYTINGQLYEAYWDIVFALNLMDEYQRTDDFYMINKKAEHIHGENSSFMRNPIEYLRSRSVNEGASGASDITFCYKEPAEHRVEDSCSGPSFSKEACAIGTANPVIDKRIKYYFCSSKFYKKDSSKSAESFDIQKIYTAVKRLHNEYDVRIILLVKDKDAVDTKLRNARNKYISEEASRVYGERDLFAALLKLYDLVHHKTNEKITETVLKNIVGISDSIKPILSPRLHQHMAIIKIHRAILDFKKNGGSNKFLVGILPRGGKTYIAGGIVSALQPRRVVVLLGAKSETISQFTKDLFDFYQDFSEYQIVDVVEDTPYFTIDKSKKYIFVMSVELYKMKSSRQILKDLKGGANKADLFICDEAHLKQMTVNAMREMEEGTAQTRSAAEEDKEESSGLMDLHNEIERDVPVVYMTGTYIKPLTALEIPDAHTAIWEYQDVQEGKNIIDTEEYFKNNFPGIYEEALAKCFSYGETYESIQSMYRRFPNLYLLSTQFTEDAKSSFLKQSAGGEKVGFPTITHLFQVKKDFSPIDKNPSLWHTGFTNPAAMARLINYMSPRSEIVKVEETDVAPISSIMSRIDRISQRIGDRLAFFTSDFIVHSQLWFLPSMQGHPLIKRMCALAGMIFQSPWYKKYFNILAVSSSADWSKIPGAKDRRIQIDGGTFTWACPSRMGDDTLKACILREEAAARAQGKGLIILAQNMLHLGISLTCVDIVVLLDVGEKVDERIQKMYRALTESTNKKGGFIVDLNYFRTVTAIMNYQIQATKARHKKEVYADSGLKETFNAIINTYSIDDDLDIYGTNEQGHSRIESETIPELQRILQRTPTARSDGITLVSAGSAMNTDIEGALKGIDVQGIDHLLGELADNSMKRTLRTEGEGVAQAEESDKEPSKEPSAKAPKLFADSVEKNPVEKRKAFIDIFKTTMKIGVFGTAYKTVPELIEALKTDRTLQESVYDTLIKRGTIQEYSEPSIVIRLIIRELEYTVGQKSNNSYSGMKEAFNSKEVGTTFQEVLEYIKAHLTPKDTERHKYGEVFTPLELVDEMLSRLPEEVWGKKDIKWLDPANGIGNFPIKVFIGQKEGKYTYPGLMEGLKKEIPNDKERCTWIIENMLYMIDINGKNNLIARRLFEKLCPGAKANIEKIDAKSGFTTDKPLIFNGKTVNEFDIIIGNPPYNKGTILRKHTRKVRANIKEMGLEDTKRESLWTQFVVKIFTKNILKKNGYLLFITPINWFHPEISGVRDIFLSKQIDYIRIIFLEQSKKLFGGSGELTTAHYLIQNKESTKPTLIIDMNNNKDTIRLTKDSILILAYNSIYAKVCNKSELFMKTDTIKSTAVKGCNAGSNKHIIGIYESGDIKFVKTSEKHPLSGIPKIIINGYTYPRYYYDKDGEYGKFSKDGTNFIIVGEDLHKVKAYFDTKLSALLLNYIKFTQKKIDPKYYPDVRTLPLEKISDETLADYFGFTEGERKAIDATQYPKREYNFKEVTCAQLKGEKGMEGGSHIEGGWQRRFTRKAAKI